MAPECPRPHAPAPGAEQRLRAYTADLAGAKTPSFVDGRSLVPLLTDDLPSPNNWRQAFLVEAASEGRGPPSPLADEGSIKPLLTGDPLPGAGDGPRSRGVVARELGPAQTRGHKDCGAPLR